MGTNATPQRCNLILLMYELLSPLPNNVEYTSSRFIDDLFLIHPVHFTPLVQAHLTHTYPTPIYLLTFKLWVWWAM